MELTVAIYERRRGGMVYWWTLGLGELNRSRYGKSAVKLRQRLIGDLRKALQGVEASRLEALQLPVGIELQRPRLELSLRATAGGRRRRSGRFPLVVAPRAASPGRRLRIAYHPLRQEAWFPLSGVASLEEQATLFYQHQWRDLDDDALSGLESSRRDGLRFLTFNARTCTLLDTLRRDDSPAPATAGGPRARFALDDVGVNESQRVADGRLPLGRPRAPYRERLGRLLAGPLEAGQARPSSATPVLLVGRDGAGKTTLIHRLIADLLAADGLAAHGNLDRCRQVWRISGRRLIAGMSLFGQWEERAIALIAEAGRRVVLWVEDLHAFGRLGRTVESERALADVFATPLGRREIIMVGECTPAQLQVLEDDAPALAAAFTVVRVAEPPPDETLSMLIGEVRELELEHRVIVEPAALRSLLEVSATLFTASAQPGTALELLRALVRQDAGEGPGGERRRLGGREVLALVSQRTGIPPLLLEPSRRLTAAEVEARLGRAVLGQDQAIAAAREVILRLKTGLADPGRPYASLLFTGPTGTGKTELAKAIAATLYHGTLYHSSPSGGTGASRLRRFDMSEYSDPDAPARLAGDRARPRGLLTAALREQPFCVVLLDEIDKCHPGVLHLLLQVMGDGRLTDAAGDVADFSHSVLIMTSNLGAGRSRVGFGEHGEAVVQEAGRAVRAHFPPELFNRIDRVVPFLPLSAEVARAIAARELARLLRRRGLLDRDIFVSATGGVLDRVAREGFDPEQGARSLKRYLDRHVGGLLAESIAGSSGAAMQSVLVYAPPPGFALHAETLVEAAGAAESRLEPLLSLPVEELRGRLPAALAAVEALLEGPEVARVSAELRRHLQAFHVGTSGAAEKIYDLDAMRERMSRFRDRLARQIEAAEDDDSELIELEQFGVLTLREEDRWGDKLRARVLDRRAFATAPRQAGKAELLALLAEAHFLRRALVGVRDPGRHAVFVELRRVGRRVSGGPFSAPAEGLLEWLAAAYGGDFGELEGFATEVAGETAAADGGASRIVEGTRRRQLTAALERRPRHLVLKVAGLSVLDLFAGEAGCHLSSGLGSPAEIVSVAVRPAAAEEPAAAVLEAHAARRRRFIRRLESGAGNAGEPGERASLRGRFAGTIVRRYRYDPPAPGGWTVCEVEDYTLCHAGSHRVRSFAEVIAVLGLLHRSSGSWEEP